MKPYSTSCRPCQAEGHRLQQHHALKRIAVKIVDVLLLATV